MRNILFSQWHKLLEKRLASSELLPTGVEPMTFRTPVGHSTTELQETYGSLGYIARLKCDKPPAYSGVSLILEVSGLPWWNMRLWPIMLGGMGACSPRKFWKCRSSEMQFPTFWESNLVLYITIFIDHSRSQLFWSCDYSIWSLEFKDLHCYSHCFFLS